MGLRIGTDYTKDLMSWQQAARLRDERKYGAFKCISNTFRIPATVSDAEIELRLRDIITREDALRIVAGSLSDHGWVAYAHEIDLPLRFKRCDSVDEMLAWTRRLSSYISSRDGRPLWGLTIIEFPSEHGRIERVACSTFDHFLSDAWSMHLLEQELTRPPGSRVPQSGNRYRDWVRWQRAEFPLIDSRPGRACREFWLRHLDGTSPDRPTTLPFTVPPSETSLGVTSINLPLPISVETLRAAAARENMSPFVLVLGSVANTVARVSGINDITMRVISNGRSKGYFNAHGWFADSVPIRISDPDLSDPERFLAIVWSKWMQLLTFHTTPIDYIRTNCRASSDLEIPVALRKMQLVLNFMTHDIGGMYSRNTVEETKPGDIDGLHIMVLPDSDGRYRLGAMFPSGSFPKNETRLFLQQAATGIAALVERR